MIQSTLQKNDQGFTLVEVMIALMIVAIALTAIIRVTIQSAKQEGYLRNKTIAQWVAMNIVSEFELGIRHVSKTLNHQEGETQMLNKTWYWTALFHQTEYKSLLRMQILVGLHKNKRRVGHLIAFLRIP